MRILTITYVINGTDYDTVDVDTVLTDFGLVPSKEASTLKSVPYRTQ